MADHDDEAKETLEEKGRKRFAVALNQGECPPLLVWRLRKLDRGETTTTGGCLAISGATPILSVLSAPGRFSCLY